jgi:hypothetical protein
MICLDVIEQLINRKANNPPMIVNRNGTFFNSALANSESIIIKFSKDVVMLFRKRGDPSPIIISFERNPQKILPIDNTINGKPILIGAS